MNSCINKAALPCLLMVICLSCNGDQVVSVRPEPLFFECGDGIRYPTTEMDFEQIYNHRGFDAEGVVNRGGVRVVTYHLGHDILYTEGTAIHPIACGTVVHYTPASGYGTLAAVVEHRLSRPVQVHNGDNELVTISSFLSIYGHLRPTSLILGAGVSTGLTVGSSVTGETIIGYVEHADERPGHEADDLNGDGDMHCHLGIRLQSSAEAIHTDPGYWFRGYDDSSHTYRGYFADAAIFMGELENAVPVKWHPTGTFIVNREDESESYLVVSDSEIVRVDPAYRIVAGLDRYAIRVGSVELGCYHHLDWGFPPESPLLATLVHFDGDPAVYELHDIGGYRLAFVSQTAFDSWGLRDADVRHLAADQRMPVLGRYADHGLRRMRPGSLVKAFGLPQISFVTESERLPFADWDTFTAMGYGSQTVYEVDATVLDAVANPPGAMITHDLAFLCRVPSCSGSSCVGTGPGGGGAWDDDAGPSSSPDAGTPPPSGGCTSIVELCNGLDDNCDGIPDNGIPDRFSSNACGAVQESCRDGYWLMVNGRDPEPERCNAGDDDCDGLIDEGCAPVCVPIAEICDGLDQNCNGLVDDGVAPIGCSTACGSGTRACVGGTFGSCSARAPSAETCNGLDDDCDGVIDDGVCTPAIDPNLVRISLVNPRPADCAAGWVIRLWLASTPEESPRGGSLERIVTPRLGHSAITLYCPERSPYWYAFSPSSASAADAGIFSEISIGGVDMRSSTMICTDPCTPSGGLVPIINWDPSVRGRCPATCF